LLHNTKRKALNFSDAMKVVAPAWSNAMSAENNQIAWRKGGLRPFTRMPEMLFRWTEMKNDARRQRKKQERSMKAASIPKATDETELNWQALISTAPMKRSASRNDDDDDEAGESGAEADQAVSGKMGAAVYFNTTDEMRGHSVAFHAEVRDIKAMGVPELKSYIEDIKKEKDPSWPVEFSCKNSAVLDLIEWNSTFYHVKITDQLLGKKELIELSAQRKRPNARASPQKAPPPAPAPPPKNRFHRRDEADKYHPEGVAYIAALVASTSATATATANTAAAAPAPAPAPAAPAATASVAKPRRTQRSTAR